MMQRCLITILTLTVFVPCAIAAETNDDGWKCLFDGKHWVTGNQTSVLTIGR